jgi:hypothetical protein
MRGHQVKESRVGEAVDPMLPEHRDFICREFLRLPLERRGAGIWLAPGAKANLPSFP